MQKDCWYGVYERLPDGRWLYPWGDEVLGARDVTVRDVLQMGPVAGRECSADGTGALGEDPLSDPPQDLSDADADLDRVVGMTAPELHVRAMLTLGDIAEMVGVARDTIAAYRYRGYLPEPQAFVGRTPVWSRPVVRHWLENRPGNGWRTDIYGDREEYAEWVRHRRTARRRRRAKRASPR